MAMTKLPISKSSNSIFCLPLPIMVASSVILACLSPFSFLSAKVEFVISVISPTKALF